MHRFPRPDYHIILELCVKLDATIVGHKISINYNKFVFVH